MSEDIKAEKWENFKNTISIKKGYAVIMFTDKFLVCGYPFDSKTEMKLENDWTGKLLDIRVFNTETEYRVFRGDVGSPFIYCVTDDSFTDYFFDDEQYLDIDSTKTKCDGTVMATGGGEYNIPLEIFGAANDKREIKVYIRNYIDYDKKYGQAYIKRWRITDIRRVDD